MEADLSYGTNTRMLRRLSWSSKVHLASCLSLSRMINNMPWPLNLINRSNHRYCKVSSSIKDDLPAWAKINTSKINSSLRINLKITKASSKQPGTPNRQASAWKQANNWYKPKVRHNRPAQLMEHLKQSTKMKKQSRVRIHSRDNDLTVILDKNFLTLIYININKKKIR